MTSAPSRSTATRPAIRPRSSVGSGARALVPPLGRRGAPRWLVEQGDWVLPGAADEQKAAAAGTVEAWGRSADNPVGGRYGLRNGYRGRFGMYLPPLLEALDLAEVTHDARNNRMRAKP